MIALGVVHESTVLMGPAGSGKRPIARKTARLHTIAPRLPLPRHPIARTMWVVWRSFGAWNLGRYCRILVTILGLGLIGSGGPSSIQSVRRCARAARGFLALSLKAPVGRRRKSHLHTYLPRRQPRPRHFCRGTDLANTPAAKAVNRRFNF